MQKPALLGAVLVFVLYSALVLAVGCKYGASMSEGQYYASN